MDALNDRAIRGLGTPEPAWLPWLARTPIRSMGHEQLVPPGARLVVVAPHPDDEVLACGGLLALRARQDLPLSVIAVTDGEASHGDGSASTLARLAARRTEESYAGLRSLGVPPSCVARMGIPDGRVAGFTQALAHRLQRLLRPGDVVVTTWSMDGHPDHEATAAAALQAARAAGCSVLQAPVWMWHWAEPGDARIPWHDMVCIELPPYVVQAKREALGRHLSQREARGETLGPVLLDSIVQRAARPREYFLA